MSQMLDYRALTPADLGRTTTTLRPEASDALRQLWFNLFEAREGAGPKSLMVTSPQSGDGVTQIAAGLLLAAGYETRSERTILLEFNWERPCLASLFGVRTQPGLTDILTADAPIGACVSQVGERQHLLVAGDRSMPSLPEKSRIAAVLKTLTDHHDRVIIDAPPVSAPMTRMLAGVVERVALVVWPGVTRQAAAREAGRQLELAGGKLLGAILNQAGKGCLGRNGPAGATHKDSFSSRSSV